MGDWVFLRLQPYRQISLGPRGPHKLSPRFYGPFRVLSCIGEVAYKLDLPIECRIHPVFHVSCLKKKLGEMVQPAPQLPPISDSGVTTWQPLRILDRRLFKRINMPVTRLLIQWTGFSAADATWEDYSEFVPHFPAFPT